MKMTTADSGRYGGGGGGGGGGGSEGGGVLRTEENDIEERKMQDKDKPDHLRAPIPTAGDYRGSGVLQRSGPGKHGDHKIGDHKNGDHKIGDKNTSGGRALTKHILDIIEQVRGHRPTAKSSFATIGVDSLGAVMFIKQVTPLVLSMY